MALRATIWLNFIFRSSSVSIMPVWVRLAVLLAADLEGVQVRVRPAHARLDDVVQLAQRVSSGQELSHFRGAT